MTLLRITNTPRDYAWGSLDLIPDLLGQSPTGSPQAEVWFGTHPDSDSQVLDEQNGTLSSRVGELGFLVKYLAAEKPLSIQAHPTKQWAAKRFAEGYPGYTDANHKPELIAAVSDFRALCGFRRISEITQDLTALLQANHSFQPWLNALAADGLRGATKWALEQDSSVVSEFLLASKTTSRAELISEISDHFPNDVGLLVSLLLNYVELKPTQALFLPAGNIHAYLSGLGVEVMASSNNVLRGGLTVKPIDIPELMAVADFRELMNPVANQKLLMAGLTEYLTDVHDFHVYRVEPSGSNLLVDIRLTGKAILTCVAGEIAISTSKEETLVLSKGQACFFEAANYFSILGSGTGYLALG
ncbi:MAG: mannose-6-phosphate isomerase, class I [Aquiluna sp.]